MTPERHRRILEVWATCKRDALAAYPTHGSPYVKYVLNHTSIGVLAYNSDDPPRTEVDVEQFVFHIDFGPPFKTWNVYCEGAPVDLGDGRDIRR